MNNALAQALLAIGLAGCSTVATPAGERWCQQDSDCYAHERCSQAHGGRCVSRQLPRRPSFGIAGLVQARGTHGELAIPWEFRGCEIDAFDPDTGVSRINLDRKLRPLHLGNLSYNRPYENSCAASCAPQAFCDPLNGQCAFARHGSWTLLQESRLGSTPLETHVHLSERARRDNPPSLAFPWPCGPNATWIKETKQGLTAQLHTPELTIQERHRILAPILCTERGERTMDSVFHDLSWRSLPAQNPGLDVTVLQEPSSEAEGEHPPRFDLEWVWPGAPQELLMAKTRPGVQAHAERLCARDQDCPTIPGLKVRCSEAGRCKAQGSRAQTLRTQDLSPGLHPQPLHRGESLPSWVRVHPSDPRVARMQVALAPNGKAIPLRAQGAPEPVVPRLCLPIWSTTEPTAPIELHSPFGPIDWKHHSPLPLLTGRMACNAADLARGDGHGLGPCIAHERPRLRLLASLSQVGKKAFQKGSCLFPEPLGNPFGRGQESLMGNPFGRGQESLMGNPFGRGQEPESLMGNPFGRGQDLHFALELPLDCDGTGRCQVWPTQAPVAGPCHHLALEIERPPGSLFRSIRRLFPEAYCAGEAPKALSLPQVWQPRPLIRGAVQVPDDSAEALHIEVLAERLNVGEDDPQGPYFFHQQVVTTGPSQGQFALPVEPGRYVVTALSHHPLQWGPAPYAIVDLSAPSVNSPEIHLQMQTGPLVQVQVHTPESMDRVRARPLDLGSWKGDPSFPDLNDKQTCFPLDQGCAIRMLSAPQGRQGREIPADIRSVLRWTSRPGGPVECP